MRKNVLFSLLIFTLLSSCSIFKRDNKGYEDSGSVKDLSVPPELVLPTRDQNYSIPDVPETAAEEAATEEAATEEAAGEE